MNHHRRVFCQLFPMYIHFNAIWRMTVVFCPKCSRHLLRMKIHWKQRDNLFIILCIYKVYCIQCRILKCLYVYTAPFTLTKYWKSQSPNTYLCLYERWKLKIKQQKIFFIIIRELIVQVVPRNSFHELSQPRQTGKETKSPILSSPLSFPLEQTDLCHSTIKVQLGH